MPEDRNKEQATLAKAKANTDHKGDNPPGTSDDPIKDQAALTFWMGDPDEDFLQDPAVPFEHRRDYIAALYGTRAFYDN